MHRKTLTITAIIVSSLLLTGCFSKKTATDDTAMMQGHDTHTTQNTASGSAQHMADHQVVITSEEDFIMHMIPHHEEAVNSAEIVLEATSNQEIRDLALDIITAQTNEISQMKGWMKSWYPKSTGEATYKEMMPDLTTLSGSELDKAFLSGMIEHHRGAILMAQRVIRVQHRNEVMKMANAIMETQSQEIAEMQRILSNIK